MKNQKWKRNLFCSDHNNHIFTTYEKQQFTWCSCVPGSSVSLSCWVNQRGEPLTDETICLQVKVGQLRAYCCMDWGFKCRVKEQYVKRGKPEGLERDYRESTSMLPWWVWFNLTLIWHFWKSFHLKSLSEALGHGTRGQSWSSSCSPSAGKTNSKVADSETAC